MSKKNRIILIRIITAGIIYAGLFVVEHTTGFKGIDSDYVIAGMFIVPYLVAGYDILARAFRNICHGKIFDENFLMIAATFGAFGIREFSEAVAVMLFFQTGELFQSCAVDRSRKSISDMMNICPEYANIEEDGVIVKADPDDIQTGTVIIIKPGERIPLDGVVIDGETMIDTSALTGESVPRRVKTGDEVISGCINGNNTIKVRTTKLFQDSTVSRILELVENAAGRKSPVENFITRFAKYYTPVVTIGALFIAIIPSFITGDWGEWISRACIFLVISCPCALVISVPLGFFGGIGAASKAGVLVKGSNFLEAVADMTTIVFDKTGTLTKGEFRITEVIEAGMSKDRIIEMAAYGEAYSNHPIGNLCKETYEGEIDYSRICDAEEIPGHGIRIMLDGREVLVGNEGLMKQNNVDYIPCKKNGTIVYVAYDGGFAGTMVISDVIKEDAVEAILDMKRLGVRETVMLTGDRRKAADSAAAELGIDRVYAELLPADKVSKLEELIERKKAGEKIAFVGDGINDAPVLTRADIGIAMGSMGSDAAIEAADIVLMDDDVKKIATLVKISRKTLRIVRENIVFALAVKLAVLLMGAFGVANMWEAVFADVGVSVIAILNSFRCLYSVNAASTKTVDT